MTKNITENINKTEIITKKIISLFIPICLLLISFSLVNCPDPGTDTSTPGNGNGNGGGQPEVPTQIIVEYRSAVTNKDVTQSGFLLSLKDEPTGDVNVSITISRSDSLDIKLKKGTTGPADETITVPFTKQNWNTPQEILLDLEGNSHPDQTVVRIVFSVTSTADAAYNDLTYFFSGNLTHLGIPKFRIHVHNAQSPEPEDTDAKYTTETDCTTAGGAWDGTACTVDDDRNIKVWFSLEPSIDSLGQAAVCVAEGGLWSDPHCVITSINACEKAYGAGTWDSVAATCGSTITAETACTASGNTWDGTTSTCGSTITAQASCEATTGNTWVSGTSTCSITAEAACLSTTGNTWNSGTDTCQSSDGSTIMAETACLATTGNTWDGTDTCFITAEKACLATTGNAWNSTTFTCSSITSEAACNAYGKNWDGTTSTCVSYITAEAACRYIDKTWDNNICTISASHSCGVSGDATCDSITLENACAATLYGTWDSANAKCIVMPERACEGARGVWNSSNSTCSIAEDLACAAAGNTWINKAEPVCAITNPQSHDNDITITYTVTDTDGTASAGTDYTAPTTTPEETTVTIPASSTSAYIEIPLVADSVSSPSDEGDETFKVSITSVSTSGANLSIADADATVTIGNPKQSSNYFFPNRPLMRGEKAADVVAGVDPVAGETPSFECYLIPATGDTFALLVPNMTINHSFPSLSLTVINTDNDAKFAGISEYWTETIFPLLSISTSRVFIRLFFDPTGSGYNPVNNYLYSCLGTLPTGHSSAIKSSPQSRFGMLEFGQAYEYK